MKLSSLNKGLVLHMPLDEESLQSATVFADKTSYENVGTSANAPVFVADRMGQIRAMQFNGTTDYVDCGNDASLDFGNDDFSMSIWFKSNFMGIHTEHLLNKGTTAIGEFDIYINTEGNINFRGSAAFKLEILFADWDSNYWNNLVISRNGIVGKFYLNGVDVCVDYSAIADMTNVQNLLIGKAFNGSIADVRIYKRAITQQEITALYEMYRPKISLGSLMAGCVLDMPLTSQRYNAGNSKFDDLTPYENRGINSGTTIGADYASFNGTSDNIRIPDSESLSPTITMSTMCWVKGVPQNGNLILSHYDNGINQKAFSFTINNISPYNKIRIYISADGTSGGKDYTSSIITFDDTWHLISFTFDAGTLKLFVDGVEDTNPTKTIDNPITTIHNSTADVMVGCYLNSNTPAGFFAGDIAKARMYNRALTPAEWLLVFEKQKGAFL